MSFWVVLRVALFHNENHTEYVEKRVLSKITANLAYWVWDSENLTHTVSFIYTKISDLIKEVYIFLELFLENKTILKNVKMVNHYTTPENNTIL